MKDAWKYALIAIGAIAMTIFFVRLVLAGNEVPQSNYTLYVDVTDGQLYQLPQRGRTLLATEAHPDEPGVYKLFKVTQDEDTGEYIVPVRYLGPGQPFEFNNVDMETGRVDVTGETPIRVNLD
jgi:hypothetical protein